MFYKFLHICSAGFYRKAILTYLAIVVVVIALIMPFYNNTYHIVKNNIEQENYMKIQQGISMLENEMDTINSLSSELINNTDFKTIADINGKLAAKDYISLKQSGLYFRQMMASISIIDDVFVVFPYNSSVISRARVYDNGNRGFDQLNQFGDYNFEQLRKQYLSRAYYNELCPSITINNSESEPYSALFFANSLPVSYVWNSNYYLVLTVFKVDKVIQLCSLQNLQGFANIQITTNNGNVLYASKSIDEESKTSNITYPFNKGSLAISVDIAKSYYDIQLISIRRTIMIYISISFIIAVLFSGIFAYIQFNPLNKLLDVVHNIQGDHSKRISEYKYIEQVITSISIDNLHMKNENEQLHGEIAYNLLHKLIIIGLSRAEYDVFSNIYPDFPKTYQLLVLKCKNCPDLHWENKIKSEFSTENLSYYLLANIINDCIVIILDGKSIDPEKLYASLKNVTSRIKQANSWEMLIGVSKIEVSISAISEVYRETLNALKYLKFDQIITLGCIDENKGKCISDLNENIKLFELLLSGDKLQANRIIHTHWDKVSQKFPVSYAIEQTFFTHIGVISNVAYTVGYTGELPGYDDNESIMELEADLVEVINKLCMFIAEKRRHINMQLSHDIVQYIDNNFTNPYFYMRDLVEKFNLTDRTITKIVKQQTGKNFSDYLESLKSAKAEELLRSRDNSIVSVAAKCGFNSRNTFYKAFRRVYGISPSEYRDNVIK